MSWNVPDDLVLIAECETLPEIEVLKSLLASAGMESSHMSTSESGAMFGHKSMFSPMSERPQPYKLLVRSEDAEEALALINAPAEELEGDE